MLELLVVIIALQLFGFSSFTLLWSVSAIVGLQIARVRGESEFA